MPKEPRAAEFEQLVLLAILRLKENAYGMSIRREIEDRTERRTSLGAVYTTLDRLERLPCPAARRPFKASLQGATPRQSRPPKFKRNPLLDGRRARGQPR
jgi:hypothetical protein